jgi:hypothetical protein
MTYRMRCTLHTVIHLDYSFGFYIDMALQRVETNIIYILQRKTKSMSCKINGDTKKVLQIPHHFFEKIVFLLIDQKSSFLGLNYSGNNKIPAVKNPTSAPITLETKTSRVYSFCLMIASRPVIKDEIPAATPAIIRSARAGLAEISPRIEPPGATESYKVLANDVPIKNNIGMAMISPTDHQPNAVLGIILQDRFVMIISFHKMNKKHL